MDNDHAFNTPPIPDAYAPLENIRRVHATDRDQGPSPEKDKRGGASGKQSKRKTHPDHEDTHDAEKGLEVHDGVNLSTNAIEWAGQHTEPVDGKDHGTDTNKGDKPSSDDKDEPPHIHVLA